MDFRIGLGYDLHRLEPASERTKPLVIGTILIPPEQGGTTLGVVAHSDGDVLAHAITDALLGSLALPDIGQLFPDTDPSYAGAASGVFLREAIRRVRDLNGELVNLDATVILERPRLSPHKPAIRRALARALGVDESVVNVKGKSHEGVDAVGERRAVEAHAVVLVRSRA